MATTNLSPHFTLDELTVTSTRHDNTPGTKELQALVELCKNVLEPLRLVVGPLVITSGYRSVLVNAACHGSPTSQHRLGEAADCHPVSGTTLDAAWAVIDANLPFDQLIYEGPGWIHVSYGPKRRGQILTAVFGSGKTKYKSGLPPRPKKS